MGLFEDTERGSLVVEQDSFEKVVQRELCFTLFSKFIKGNKQFIHSQEKKFTIFIYM